jgi:hypothetical protein
MNLRSRIARVEREASAPTGPERIVVTHTVVEPGPDGPRAVGRIVSEYANGELVRRESSGTTTAPRPASAQ